MFYKNYKKGGITIIGIYQIKNLINGKSYIGQSNNIERRFKQHQSLYEQKREPSKPLYRAFQKYGIENFTFTVLEECSLEELDSREAFWIQELQTLCRQHGYNVAPSGMVMANENHPGHKLTVQDVIDIRTSYNNHERCKKVEKRYADRIGHSGFSKIWKGETWRNIMPEVDTPENKEFHKHNTGQKGSENGRALLTEQDVIDIRTRKNKGERCCFVYEDYKHTGIKYPCFLQTWNNQNWKHVIIE